MPPLMGALSSWRPPLAIRRRDSVTPDGVAVILADVLNAIGAWFAPDAGESCLGPDWNTGRAMRSFFSRLISSRSLSLLRARAMSGVIRK